MFIPLFDVNPTKSAPVVTLALLAANLCAWVVQLGLGAVYGSVAVMYRFGLVPGLLTHDPAAHAGDPVAELPGSNIGDHERGQAVEKERARRFVRARRLARGGGTD